MHTRASMCIWPIRCVLLKIYICLLYLTVLCVYDHLFIRSDSLVFIYSCTRCFPLWFALEAYTQDQLSWSLVFTAAFVILHSFIRPFALICLLYPVSHAAVWPNDYRTCSMHMIRETYLKFSFRSMSTCQVFTLKTCSVFKGISFCCWLIVWY